MDCNGYAVHYRKGTSGMVIQAFDGGMFFCVDEKVYALDLLPEHELTKKTLYSSNESSLETSFF
jgi:hypothetical protein